MKKLDDYLLTKKREMKYRIKFAFQPKSVDQDRLERHLRKYDVVEVSPLSKTIFQSNPIDFTDIKNTEIWIMDVVLAFPVPSHVLKEEIRQLFKVAEKFIVVRGENDPLLDQADDLIEDESEDQNLHMPEEDDDKFALLDNPNYEEQDDIDGTEFYGDDYNADMVKAFRTEKEKLLGRYAKYEYLPGEGLFPDTPKDPDIKDDGGPTRETEASSPTWRK